MTSLVSWVGVDSRGPASIYIASDSRLSWPGPRTWDYGRKLFACRRYPHIFGYSGEVLFPTQTLSQITEMIDSDLIVGRSDDVDSCTQKILLTIESALKTYPSAAKFEILHCTREGEYMPSRFHVSKITFDPAAGVYISPLKLPECSEVIAALGSGSHTAEMHVRRWTTSDVEGTSRAVFSAFCDSLKSGNDPLTGGPPQLVGLWRKSAPKTFGMIWQEHCYFYGVEVNAPGAYHGVRWFNELFEICDPETLARKQGAQPQPRPRAL